MRIVRIDPDLEVLFMKALVKIDEQEDNPHFTIACGMNFENPDQFFNALLSRLDEEYKKHSDNLRKQGVQFQLPFEENEPLHPAVKFIQYAQALTDGMPDQMGALVFLLDPEEIADKQQYALTVEYLAENTSSEWVKYLVLDERVKPMFEGLDEKLEQVTVQTFYLPPEEIEKQISKDMQNPDKLTPLQKRQNLGLLAGFAYGKKDYDQAAKLQKEWAWLAQSEGDPNEAANAFYNLGNTWYAKEAYDDAKDCFTRSADICLDNNINGLLPLVLTNLGLTLNKLQRIDDAIESLKVARNTFKALKHIPGQAHVLDCLACIYHENQYPELAEKSWLVAKSLYDGITSDAFTDVREAGSKDIVEKLKRFYTSTGQSQKIQQLNQTNGVVQSAGG